MYMYPCLPLGRIILHFSFARDYLQMIYLKLLYNIGRHVIRIQKGNNILVPHFILNYPQCAI